MTLLSLSKDRKMLQSDLESTHNHVTNTSLVSVQISRYHERVKVDKMHVLPPHKADVPYLLDIVSPSSA